MAPVLALPATAGAVEQPGVPIPSAPGVPGHGRAWELVTPPDQDGLAYPLGEMASSLDGNRVAFRVLSPPPGAKGTALTSVVVGTRGSGGWTTTPFVPPGYELISYSANESFPIAYDPGMTKSIVQAEVPVEPPATGYDLELLREDPGGAVTPVNGSRGGKFKDASEDLDRVFFASPRHLLPADASRTEGSSIYEETRTGLRLVDVDDAGTLLSDCGSEALPLFGVSTDGLKAFFTTTGCGGSPSRVYLREAGSTTEVSASQCSGPLCGEEQPARLLGVTPSGSAAFLISAGRLTSDDDDDEADLFRYDTAEGKLTLIPTPPGLETMPIPVRPSPDGSGVLFCAREPLQPVWAASIYLADGFGVRTLESPCAALEPSADAMAEWSANSRYFLLTTAAALAPDDTDSYRDVYRYDADSGDFTRLSAGDGAAGNGPFNAEQPGWTASIGWIYGFPNHFMSADGEEIVFDTAEKLLPTDTNEKTDVYEWANGDLALLSGGSDPDAAAGAFGISADGRAVFFKTTATLLPRDRDGGNWDIYAAVRGGGFPEPAPPPDDCAAGCAGAPGPRVDTPPAATGGALPGGIRLGPIGAGARRRAAATGKLPLLVEVPGTGRLTASATARLAGRSTPIGGASAQVKQPGPMRLQLRLAKRARKRMAAGGKLRLTVVLRLSKLPAAARFALTLGGRR